MKGCDDMRLAYASRTGNVKSIIDRLGVTDAIDVSLSNGIDEDYILFTYTDGYGDVPYEVEDFLENSKNIKGVVVSGNKSFADTYCMAGEVISKKYNVPLLYKVEDAGTEEDIENISKLIKG